MSLLEFIHETQQRYLQLGEAAQKNVTLLDETEAVVAGVKAGLEAVVQDAGKAMDGFEKRLSQLEAEVESEVRSLGSVLESTAQAVVTLDRATEPLVTEARAQAEALRKRSSEAIPQLAGELQQVQARLELLSARERELVQALEGTLSTIGDEVRRVRLGAEEQQATIERQVALLVAGFESMESERDLRLGEVLTELAGFLSEARSSVEATRAALDEENRQKLAPLATAFTTEVEPELTRWTESLSGKGAALASLAEKPRAVADGELSETQKKLLGGEERLRVLEQAHRSAAQRELLA